MAKAAAKTNSKTKTLSYDVSEQLRTPEEMAAYLDAWLVEAPDDAAGIARALGDIARAKGMTQVARDAVHREGVAQARRRDALVEDGEVHRVKRRVAQPRQGGGQDQPRVAVRGGRG